jgi:hydroxypyruvate isomerase
MEVIEWNKKAGGRRCISWCQISQVWLRISTGIQVADSPGRHEPGTGEIHYLNVLAALDALGYQGYVGLEYNPTTSSEASLAWLPGDRSGMLAVSDLRL